MISITLRPATMEDAKDLFRWKNDLETRKFAIAKHEKISWEEHMEWLKHELENNHLSTNYIIMGGNRKLGTIRTTGFLSLEIAIRIDKKYRGLGIATKVLTEQTWKLPTYAKIVDGNIASMRTFINAGYKPKSYRNGVYIYEKTR